MAIIILTYKSQYYTAIARLGVEYAFRVNIPHRASARPASQRPSATLCLTPSSALPNGFAISRKMAYISPCIKDLTPLFTANSTRGIGTCESSDYL
jgi:hypothetical protein